LAPNSAAWTASSAPCAGTCSSAPPSPSWSEFQFESALEGQRLVPSDSGDEIRPPGGSRSATGGRLYQDMEKEKTFAECDYYHLPPGRDTAQRVSVNAFWLEYARHLANRPGEPFLSANFVDPVFNFTEMMLALAVLDLPRQASVLPPPRPAVRPATAGHCLCQNTQWRPRRSWTPAWLSCRSSLTPRTAGTRTATARRRSSTWATASNASDRTAASLSVCARLTTVNNLSGIQKQLELYYAVPDGAVSLSDWFTESNSRVTLPPYTTKAFTFFFYFPRTGSFKLNAAQAGRDIRVLARAGSQALTVAWTASPIDLTLRPRHRQEEEEETLVLPATSQFASLTPQTSYGSYKEALVFTQGGWEAAVRTFPTVQVEALRDLVEMSGAITTYYQGSVFHCDPAETKLYEFLESSKAIIPRLYEPTSAYSIPRDLHRAFIHYVVWKPELSVPDLLMAVYYAVLRSDLRHAQRLFARIPEPKDAYHLQWAYLAAYLDFSFDPTNDLEQAQAALAKYQVLCPLTHRTIRSSTGAISSKSCGAN
jgi:hypothetical protein